jgi:hypothetical protein
MCEDDAIRCKFNFDSVDGRATEDKEKKCFKLFRDTLNASAARNSSTRRRLQVTTMTNFPNLFMKRASFDDAAKLVHFNYKFNFDSVVFGDLFRSCLPRFLWSPECVCSFSILHSSAPSLEECREKCRSPRYLIPKFTEKIDENLTSTRFVSREFLTTLDCNVTFRVER